MRKIEIFVGFFIFLGFLSLLLLAFKVSDIGNLKNDKSNYKISAKFTNIGGLKKRAKVTIGGVKIGYVTNITLKENEYFEYVPVVEMSIKSSIHIPIDSSASIVTSGLLGDNYISIDIGCNDVFIENNGIITLTSQALLLEDLLAKFGVG
ncbi:MAG TPA: outer membrane lipid asymmetry maintenance protein MlaD [Candidatus Azosocius sp. HAIN]